MDEIIAKLPEHLLAKVTAYLLSYGTPSAQIMRAYIERTMYKLPEQSCDDNRTLWRYHAYASRYGFIHMLKTSSYKGLCRYQKDVQYEIISALIESADCLTAVNSDIIGELKAFVKFTLEKLFRIRMFSLCEPICPKCVGTPCALIIKQHMKDEKTRSFANDFY